MDPSYNNSFGSFQQPVVSSGTGDVVLNNSEGKGKKWLVIGVLVAAAVVIAVMVLMIFVTNGSNRGAKDDRAEFHELLSENGESINHVLSFMNAAQSGVFAITDFLASADSESVEMILNGIESLNKINEAITSKDFSLGEGVYDINIYENYEGLKKALERDLAKYEMMANMTVIIFEIFQQDNPEESLSSLAGYNVPELYNTIFGFIEAANNINREALNNNCVNDDNNDVCRSIANQYNVLIDSMFETIPVVQAAYQKVGSGVIFNGEESISFYLNNLYVGTDDEDEE